MIDPELIVVIPTRGRPDNIRRVLEAWDFTGAWDVAEMVLAVDADDTQLKRYDSVVEEWCARSYRPASMVIGSVWAPMVTKLNATATGIANYRQPFAIGFAGDDHVPRTIGWAQAYITALHELGTGMVYGDDGIHGRKFATEWAVTSDAIRAIGAMVPAPVEHLYCDNAMMEWFGDAGALRHLPQVVIEHMHYTAGKSEADDQYRRVNSREQYRDDRRRFETWQRTEKADHVAKVVALRGDREPERPRPPKQKGTRMARYPFPHFFKPVVGLTPDEIGVTLADFAYQVPADQAIVELGVFQGRTSLQMAWGSRQGNGAHLWGIDAWDLPGNPYGDVLGDLEKAKRWARHNVQSLGYSNQITLIQGFAAEVAEKWSVTPVGLLFVDDDHSAAGCRAAIEAWAPHLAPGATIAIDDYGREGFDGVAEAVDAMVAEGVLEPMQVYHDRLAVTRLVSVSEGAGERSQDGLVPPRPTGAEYADLPTLDISAITSEGVSPPPIPDIPKTPDMEPLKTTLVQIMSGQVAEGELNGVAAGTPVDDLGLAQLRALARLRGIVLGQRKDRKADIIQALKDGR